MSRTVFRSRHASVALALQVRLHRSSVVDANCHRFAIKTILACGFLLFWPLGIAAAEAAHYFVTLPPHASLPSDRECAADIAPSNWEPRPDNYAANHRQPTALALMTFHLHPVKGSFAPIRDFLRVNGSYTGTTDQILRWAACKWGIDENVVRAEAVVESHWRQSDLGDQTTNIFLCPPGSGFPGAWNGSFCMQSYGILQMKFHDFGGWPWSKDSTAFNADFRMAYQRACMNGDISYLPQEIPAFGYPRYPEGTSDQMLWGCMGDWYSGSWYDSGSLDYIAQVKKALVQKLWLQPGF
ncbi:MAG TPA: hypothetical protein VKV28_12695 [Candidatus Binataceae bacterium]|nr:hypothetical protein [Candidatus Binataceae bacterium]